ncbi:batten's disease protein Cln3 [Microthyrium microscopicum]|uniref:Protein BTN n=1 Tax=Microthyrium microscopicum TaxID=703497 RepID=A0A6A6U9L3_9PEZI|nr:batten's disease protein Cln3 [Microthyrium microscopicum]
MLPMPFSPSSSWPAYKARLKSLFDGIDSRVFTAFWFFGLINNVLYVIILSAALDLVGPSIPKSLVLLADVLPSLITKLVAPYLLHLIPYNVRIFGLVVAPASCGMLLIALSPGGTAAVPDTRTSTIAMKLFGVMLASFASGAGELTFLGLMHYYGRWSLAAWGSGTGAAGLVGASAYVVTTTWIGLSVRTSLLTFATLPLLLIIFWVFVLPKEALNTKTISGFSTIAPQERETASEHYHREDDDLDDSITDLNSSSAALIATEAQSLYHTTTQTTHPSFTQNLARVRRLIIPYMAPLFLVYLSEYLINQAVSPTLLFPLPSTPFKSYREFYPVYAAIYQTGVFLSRTSIAFFHIRHLYVPSFLQFGNLALLSAHAMFDFLPSVWVVWMVIFWEGLLGGLVYVSTFAAITEGVRLEDREFSLSAASVSDSAGITVAGLLGLGFESALCRYQVAHGRDYCRKL